MKILITESQLKYLITEGQIMIKVTNECGVTKTYDYQTWYYDISKDNPQGSNWDGVQSKPRRDINTYTIDGSTSPYTAKFNGDWSYIISNIKSISAESLENKKCVRCKGIDACRSGDRFGVAAAMQKSIQSFASWVPQTIQDWVDWITWFISWLGPQGKVLATATKGIQGMAYIYFGFTSQTLRDSITKIIEGMAQLLDIAGWKIKVPGFSSWVEKITNFLEKNSFSSIISKLISKGQNVNEKFNSIPKWAQAVVILIAQAVGDGVSAVFNWIVNNILNPLYGFILKYNTNIANGLKTMIDYLLLFSSLIVTANIIITNSETKGSLNLTTS